MRIPLSCFVFSVRQCCLILTVTLPMLVEAQYAGPIYFNTPQDYDDYFKEGASNDGITHDPSGYIALQGSPGGIAIYDASSSGGSNGSGGTSGDDVNNDFDDVTVSARIGSSNYHQALFRAGYLLRLDDNEENGYLVQVTSGQDEQSVIFEIFEGAGASHSGNPIFSDRIYLDSMTLEADAFYRFKVSLNGGTFTMDFANGEASTTFTDTSISASQGQIGLVLSTANSTVQVNLDDFSVNNPLVQEEITGSADYGSGTGQSFILPPGETIRAIELHIEHGGGSIELNLWRTYRGGGFLERDSSTPAASGVLLKDTVENMTPDWFRITLDQPYTNDSPESEELVFDFELLTAGSDGWNDYSFSDQNPYQHGAQVNWSDHSGEYTESSTDDMAFRMITNTTEPPLFSYFDVHDGVVIDGYFGDDSDVVIPSQIDGKAVLVIRKEIFFDASVPINSVSVPETVEFIDDRAFVLCCNELTSISVSPENPYYRSFDGVLFNKDMTALLRCPDAKSGTYIIPSGVTVIEDNAFRSCTRLNAIHIPEGVSEIASYAFSGCGGITNMTLPSTLTKIGASAFASMVGLTSITIPASLIKVETRAFQYCRSLETVTIENGVETLSSYVFASCYSLKTLTLPPSVNTIGAYCFNDCTNLEALLLEGDAPDLVNIVFGNNSDSFGIYHPDSKTGYTGEDWDTLPVYAYTGPSPASDYSRWLARQQVHTETPDETIIPSSSLSYLIGYALNLDLSQNIQKQLPSALVIGEEMRLTFYADSAGITYTPKASTDLADWETVPVTLGNLTASGEITATVDLSDYDRCFMHIDIQKIE